MYFKVRSVRLGESKVNENLIEASDESVAREKLTKEGETILSVRRVKNPNQNLNVNTVFNSKKADNFPLFCRELRTLTHAGMSVVEAVETLAARESFEKKSNTLTQSLLVQLHQGKSLSASLAAISNTPPVLIAAIRSGERTSNLFEALNEYLRFDALVEQLKRKVISASIYPLLVLSLGFAISIFLLVIVMPNFASMYENLRGDDRGETAMIISVSRFMNQFQLEVVIGLISFVIWLAWWIYTGRARLFTLRMIALVPYIRQKINDLYLAMMYQTLSLLLKGGYPMTEALTVARQSALSPEIKDALKLSLNKIEQGALVSESLFGVQLCDEVGRRLMAAAERNGAFPMVTEVVSSMHRERFELFIERLTRIVEPVLLMLVALVVGTLVVMMYMPIFEMTTHVR